MAYIVKNVDVLDLKPSTGVGISVPFDGATGIKTKSAASIAGLASDSIFGGVSIITTS